MDDDGDFADDDDFGDVDPADDDLDAGLESSGRIDGFESSGAVGDRIGGGGFGVDTSVEVSDDQGTGRIDGFESSGAVGDQIDGFESSGAVADRIDGFESSGAVADRIGGVGFGVEESVDVSDELGVGESAGPNRGDSPPRRREGEEDSGIDDDLADDDLGASAVQERARYRSPPYDPYDTNSDAEFGDDPGSRGNATSLNFDYSELSVSAELRDLFEFIDRYKPQDVDLRTPLKPFVPEYFPAVGEIDAFLKVPRPDGEEDKLGLVVLDEPGPEQTDPTVLEVQLHAATRSTGPLKVRGIENPEKNVAQLKKWIEKLHHSAAPPSVTYAKNMPDIDNLMSEWPSEFEEFLDRVHLPDATLDVSLEDYVRVVCAILDIPVYQNPIESLDVLFNLYSTFGESQHFGGWQRGAPKTPRGPADGAADAAATGG